MSKSFPYIKFHGNTEAGFRHVKRGMLELFKTEELQKKMGVPIMKRTAEVNEYTSITVQISKKQKIIHIHSNPPSLPEVVPPPPEQPTEEGPLCPYSFLIRKRDYTVKGLSSTYYDQDGYLIAYDHNSGRWRVGQFRTSTGETVPYAANLGWFHAKNDVDGLYTHCDIVTWHGQASPNFSAPFLNGHTTAYPQSWFLKPYFYFQGRKFLSPSSRSVLGACILEDKGIKYFYVHTCSATSFDASNNRLSYHIHDYCHRKLYSEVMAGETSGWTQLYDYGLTDLDLSNEVPMNAYAGYQYFLGPRATDYIDEEGKAYFIREYRADETVGGIDIAGLFICFNLKTGAYDILSSAAQAVPRAYRSVASQGTLGVTNDAGDYAEATNHHDNTGRPWIRYVWPGTEDLYYAGIEFKFDSFGRVDQTVTSSGGQYAYFQVGALTNHIEMTVFKNNKKHDSFVLHDTVSNLTCGASGSQTPTENIDTWANTINSFSYINRALLEYHPEIKNSKRYTESVTDPVTTTFALKDELRPAQEDFFAAVRQWEWDYSHESFGITYYDLGYMRGPVWAPYTGTPSAGYDRWYCVDGGDTIYSISNPDLKGDSGYAASVMGGALPGINPLYDLADPAVFQADNYGIAWSDRYALGAVGDTDMPPFYGSAMGFDVLSRHADGTSTTRWKPDAYAIHKPVKGVKPYLYLRRKIYLASISGYQGESIYIDIFDPYRGALDLSSGCRLWNAAKDPWSYDWDADNSEIYKQYIGGGGGLHTYNRGDWWLWSKVPGYIQDPDDFTGPYWNDEGEWELISNILTAEELNKMTEESGMDFFDIGIL